MDSLRGGLTRAAVDDSGIEREGGRTKNRGKRMNWGRDWPGDKEEEMTRTIVQGIERPFYISMASWNLGYLRVGPGVNSFASWLHLIFFQKKLDAKNLGI